MTHTTARGSVRAAIVVALSLCAQMAAAEAGCSRVHFEGEVEAGKTYRHALDAGHDFVLEALPSGWIVRILPHGGKRPPHDYAELATPPFHSPNPILVSTDFAFRAQDAVAWNPRAFHYFTTPAQLAVATAAYEATEREPNRPAAGAPLFALLPAACSGQLRILDARIVGGTADQWMMAAAVASHFAETPHTVETNSAPSPLGSIRWLKFRIETGDAAPSPGAAAHVRPAR